jgi:hypothetical protein
MTTLVASVTAGEERATIQRVSEIDARLDATCWYLHPSIFPEWIALCKERDALTEALMDAGGE